MKSHRQPGAAAVPMPDEVKRKTRSGLTYKIKSSNDSVAEMKTKPTKPVNLVERGQMQNETVDLDSSQTAKGFLPTVSQNKSTGEI